LGFFFSNNGGGGERVLWVTIWGMLQPREGKKSFVEANKLSIVIYNGSLDVSKEEILENVEVTSFSFFLSFFILVSYIILEKV
jgi:hypothetical protein